MNILTYDIEEWFHILEHPTTHYEKQWLGFKPRLEQNTDRILSLLAGRHQPATFFILGWIAKQHPFVVKKIVSHIHSISNSLTPLSSRRGVGGEVDYKREVQGGGYSLGLHSSNHKLLYESSPAEFRLDIRNGKKLLEDLTGLPVKFYRAPGFSLMESTSWAFQILNEEGFEVDCSLFPSPRIHGGMLTFPFNQPGRIDVGNGIFLKEFPINTYPFIGYPMVFSGGGYFRFWPYPIIKHSTERSSYVMSYFHPRDFDLKQPRLTGLSPLRHFMSYTGLKHSFGKLEQWLNDFQFIDLDMANQQINWDETPIFKI